MRLVVFADVLELETLWQIEIELHRRQLPQTADRILHLDVDLRAVERRFVFHPLVLKTLSIKRVDQRAFGVLPLFIRAEILLR